MCKKRVESVNETLRELGASKGHAVLGSFSGCEKEDFVEVLQ